MRDAQTGRRVLLHRQLVSSFLGRPLLPKEIVHHRDGNPRNNARENLLVLPSQQYHAHIEQLLRRERRGQALLFPEYLQAVRQRHGGPLFENVLWSSVPERLSRSPVPQVSTLHFQLSNCYADAMPANLLEPLLALSERQADVLLYIGQYFAVHRELPTHPELRTHLQLGERTNVTPYLRQLLDRGYLEKAGPKVRGRIKLTQQGIERLAVLLQDDSKAGDYQELRALIASIQGVV